MKPRINIHVSHEAARLLTDAAARPGISKASIVDAALLKFLAPNDDERRDALVMKRLDRMTRALERLADDGAAQSETLALYIRYWLCVTPPLPESARLAAEALGAKRFEHFIGQVAAQLTGGDRLTDKLLSEIGIERIERAPEREAVQ